MTVSAWIVVETQSTDSVQLTLIQISNCLIQCHWLILLYRFRSINSLTGYTVANVKDLNMQSITHDTTTTAETITGHLRLSTPYAEAARPEKAGSRRGIDNTTVTGGSTEQRCHTTPYKTNLSSAFKSTLTTTHKQTTTNTIQKPATAKSTSPKSPNEIANTRATVSHQEKVITICWLSQTRIDSPFMLN